MKRRWQFGVVFVVFALVAAACGDGSDSGPPSTAPPATTAPVTPPPTTDPQPPATTEPPAPPSTAPPGLVFTGELARADVPHATTTAISDAQLAELVGANTQFALDLLRSVAGGGDNTVVSPFSIAAALTMTYAGARGVTAEQMRDTLHMVLDADTTHEARNELALRIADVPEPAAGDEGAPMQVNIANALWGQQEFPFAQPFLETLASAYDAGVRLVDFVADAEGARTAINDWVEGETNERIVDLLPAGSVNTDTRLVLVNAIWFKASWAAPFDPAETADGSFRLLDGSRATVAMMHGTARTGFVGGDGYKAARLGYFGDASMLVIAPDEGRFDEVLGKLDASMLSSIDAGLSVHMVDLTMPRFEFESELSLRETLSALGMSAAFDPATADFSGISTARDDLHLQDVVHKAFISVDEEGTEAAAATASIVGVTSLPPPATLTLDNPFIYLIRHDSTGEILFAGTVTNPS
jgi:serpin B